MSSSDRYSQPAPAAGQQSPTKRFDGLSIVVVGVSWPMETFIDRLLTGLAGRGASLTLESSVRPTAAWLAERQISWRYGPDAPTARAAVRRLRSGGVRAAADVVVARGASAVRTRKVAPAPATNDHDVIYAPWVSTLIDHGSIFDRGAPVVTSCRGAQITIAPWSPSRPNHAAGLRRVFGRTTRVHCVSDAIRRDAEAFGLSPSIARVIRPAVDPERFRPGPGRAEPTDGIQALAVGSLIWRKDHELALLAVRHARDAGVDLRLRIVGDGPDRQHLRFTVADLGLDDHVTLVGARSPDQVLDELRAADLFLHTSTSEGISNAVLEAMACGLPVVTTDAGGMGEAVRDGVDGFVVAVRDHRSCARALGRLAADAPLRARMGRSGRQRVIERFRLDQQIDAFGQLLAEAAAS